jgi:predicted ATPase with chaperone activity
VAAARQRQAARLNGSKSRYNASMSHRQTRQFCVLDSECSHLLKGTMKPHHLNEAINYRMLDRNLWT